MDRKPDFIGIGGQRCASTWVNRCLSEHPEVFCVGIKGAHFFCEFGKKGHFDERGYWNYENGIKWYENLFKSAKDNQKAGEGTPAYLVDEQAPHLISKHYPDIKLIVSLRNPVQRAYSHYKYIAQKYDIPDTFENALENPKEFKFLENGLYAKFLSRYLEYFKKEQILVLLYDDIKKNPRQVLKKLFTFIGVDNNFIPDIYSKRINSSNAIKSKFLSSLADKTRRKLVIDWPFLLQFLKYLGIYKIGRLITSINTSKKDKSGEMVKETKNKLIKYYLDDLKQLEKIIDRDLSHWYS